MTQTQTLAFFNSGSTAVKPFKPKRTYLTVAESCDVDNVFTFQYDTTTGTITINCDEAELPDLGTVVNYKLYINGTEVKNVSVDAGVLYSSALFDKVLEISEGTYGHAPYTIQIDIANTGRSTGCTKIEVLELDTVSDTLALDVTGDTYSVGYTPKYSNTTFSIPSLTFVWKVDGKVLPVTSSSANLPINLLALYTEKLDAVCTVEIVEFGKVLTSSVIQILQNAYEVSVEFSQVISGVHLYHNIEITHNITGKVFSYFINNIKIADSHFTSSDNLDKVLTVVVSDADEWVVGESFDIADTSKYITYTTKLINGYDINSLDMMFIDSVDDNKFINTSHNERQLGFSVTAVDDYNNVLNTPKYVLPFPIDVYEKEDVLILDSSSVPEVIDGELFDKLEWNGDTTFNVYNTELARTTVTNDDLYNLGNIINSDKEFTLPLMDVATMGEYFSYPNLESKLVSDSEGKIVALVDSDIVLHKEYSDNLIQIEFTIEYEKNIDTIGAELTIMLTNEAGAIVRYYGLKRKDTDVLYHMKSNDSTVIVNGIYYVSDEIYRLTNVMNIRHMYLLFRNAKSHQFKMRKFIVTTRKDV